MSVFCAVFVVGCVFAVWDGVGALRALCVWWWGVVTYDVYSSSKSERI